MDFIFETRGYKTGKFGVENRTKSYSKDQIKKAFNRRLKPFGIDLEDCKDVEYVYVSGHNQDNQNLFPTYGHVAVVLLASNTLITDVIMASILTG